jgi:hypothetical protein
VNEKKARTGLPAAAQLSAEIIQGSGIFPVNVFQTFFIAKAAARRFNAGVTLNPVVNHRSAYEPDSR